MDKSDFLKQQFLTLREEIKETKARIFKIAGLGILGFPAAYSFAKFYQIEVLVLSLPVLICTVMVLYLSESRALMRCGRYIKTKIEPAIESTNKQAFEGWENWLERKVGGEPDRRLVDKSLASFFIVLFAIYYVASVYLAYQTGKKMGDIGDVLATAVLGAYIGVGVVFIYLLIKNFKSSTSTAD